MKIIAVVSLALLLGGCANFTTPSSIREIKSRGNYWVSYDSSRRGAWISARDGSVTSCAEPAPDVALSLSTGLKGSLKSGSTEVSGLDASATATALALAGRDNVVLLAREALFRICEQSAAGNISPAEVSKLFANVFDKTRDIAVAQADSAKAQAQTAAERTKQIQILKADEK